LKHLLSAELKLLTQLWFWLDMSEEAWNKDMEWFREYHILKTSLKQHHRIIKQPINTFGPSYFRSMEIIPKMQNSPLEWSKTAVEISKLRNWRCRIVEANWKWIRDQILTETSFCFVMCIHYGNSLYVERICKFLH
jgi:hypothetical protein